MIQEVFTTRIRAYYFDLPFEDTLNRHKQKQISNEFGEPEMRRWWRDKDYLTRICEKKITEDMGSDETIEMICQDLEMKD